jgi:hypothetical protein
LVLTLVIRVMVVMDLDVFTVNEFHQFFIDSKIFCSGFSTLVKMIEISDAILL